MRRILLGTGLTLLVGGGGLSAQGRLTMPSDSSTIQYHFQLRASRQSSGLRDTAGSEPSGGAGFMAMFGDMPLRLRVRMDGDSIPASDGKQTVSTAGLGAEAVYFFPAMDIWEPYFSLGPAFQRWEIGSDRLQGLPKRSFNKIAGRMEGGVWIHQRVALSAGLLWGRLEDGRSASDPYLALTLCF